MKENSCMGEKEDLAIPAHEYLMLLKEQIELVTKHLGIDNQPVVHKQNVGTNTTFRKEECKESCAVQTSHLDLTEDTKSGHYEPLLRHNFPEPIYDEDERKFMENNLSDLNGEGFTSISMKNFENTASKPKSSRTPSPGEQVAVLLRNVDDALGNKTFDFSQSTRKPMREMGDERRLSLPSTTTIQAPRIARNLNDLRDAEKSFILVEETPKLQTRDIQRPPKFTQFASPTISFRSETRKVSDMSSILIESSATLQASETTTEYPIVPVTEQTTYEAFSFASLDYLKRHKLL